MKASRVLQRILIPIIILAALLAVGAWQGRKVLAQNARAEQETEFETIATVPVTQGDFETAIEATGHMEAINSKRVNAETSGQILKIIPNGTIVKKGDIIMVLDVPRLLREMRNQETEYQKTVTRLAKEKANLEVAVTKAEYDLDQKTQEIEQQRAANTAKQFDDKEQHAFDEKTMARQQEEFARTKRLAEASLVPEHDVKSSTMGLKQTEFAQKKTQMDQVLADAKAASEDLNRQGTLDKAKADLERAKAALRDNDRNSLIQLQMSKTPLDRTKDQIAKAVIRSPSDGLVALEQNWDSGNRRPYAAGDRVGERNTIANIPDLSKMQVLLELSQEQARLVKRGQKAIISVDAIPEMTFPGKVTDVADTGQTPNSWLGIPGNKVFRTVVEVTDLKKKQIRPGMNCRVRIIGDHLTKTVSVPIECVFDKDGKKIVYVKRKNRFEAVEVELGQQNPDRIVIKRGLTVKDRVTLHEINEINGAAGAPQSKSGKSGLSGLPL
jgi:HlyD family secretion protein